VKPVELSGTKEGISERINKYELETNSKNKNMRFMYRKN